MSLSSSVLVALTFAGDVSRSGSASVVAGGSRGAVDPADESARGEAAWRESEGRCERLPARVIGPCVGAPAPEEEAFAFNANEAASSPDPLAVVSTDAGNGSGSGPDQTSPAKVSAGSMGLPKTLTLAGKVSRWRELRIGWLRLLSSTAEPASPSMCGGGRGEKRGDLRAEPSLVDAQEDPMVAIQRSNFFLGRSGTSARVRPWSHGVSRDL